MFLRSAVGSVGIGLLAACGAAEDSTAASDPELEQVAVASAGIAPACVPMADRMAVEDRPSPYDSTLISLGDAQAKICYGRPAMRERQIFGALIPFDTIWRTGANEPTTLHLPVAAEVAGLALDPGSYTIYTIPGLEQWTVIVNRSIDQWGIETAYTDAVRGQEVGRAHVAVESIPVAEEMFTIATDATSPDATSIVLTWENTRVRIPIRRI